MGERPDRRATHCSASGERYTARSREPLPLVTRRGNASSRYRSWPGADLRLPKFANHTLTSEKKCRSVALIGNDSKKRSKSSSCTGRGRRCGSRRWCRCRYTGQNQPIIFDGQKGVQADHGCQTAIDSGGFEAVLTLFGNEIIDATKGDFPGRAIPHCRKEDEQVRL